MSGLAMAGLAAAGIVAFVMAVLTRDCARDRQWQAAMVSLLFFVCLVFAAGVIVILDQRPVLVRPCQSQSGGNAGSPP